MACTLTVACARRVLLSDVFRCKLIRNMSAATDEVLLSRKGCAGIIELNRPKALNALNLSMIRKMYPQLLEWERDPAVGVIVIKGAGEKSFCAGGDVRAIIESAKTGGECTLSQDFFREEYILNHAIGTCKLPYVAIMDGITMGGGVGLSVHGDFRIATERTVFAMPETAIGLFPDVGGGFFLPRLTRKLGFYLALSGFRLKAQDVKKAGVATHYVEAKALSEMEDEVCRLESPTMESLKSLFRTFQSNSSYDVKIPFVLSECLGDIEKHFFHNSVEKIIESLMTGKSEWCEKQLKNLLTMSPTSLKVTLRQLHLGSQLSLAEDLKMEYRISQRCVEDYDFAEGVRALLIDKDQSPKWKPPTLKEVTEAKVDWYFSPLPGLRELSLDDSRK